MKNPLHSSNTAEWYTPAWLVEVVRLVLGHIDLDPASSDVAQLTVLADEYYTSEEDGLRQDWWGNVFLNPPGNCGTGQPVCGGKRCTCDLVGNFLEKAFDEFYHGEVTSVVYIGFNLGQLKKLNRLCLDGRDVVVCIPGKRIKFEQPDGTPGNAPTQDNFIMLITDDLKVRTRFVEIFGKAGRLWSPL